VIRLKARFHNEEILCDNDPTPPPPSPLKAQIQELIESYQYDVDHAYDGMRFMNPSEGEVSAAEKKKEMIEEFLTHLRDILSKLP